MALINILKVSTNYTRKQKKMKVLKFNNAFAIDTLKENALLSKIKEVAYPIRCFLFYCTILLYFTPFGICYNLIIDFYGYLNNLLGFMLLYTKDFVKLSHFIF